MFKREKLEGLVKYENVSFGADYKLWIDLLFNQEADLKFQIMPERLLFYMLHDQSMTSAKTEGDASIMTEKRRQILDSHYSNLNGNETIDDSLVEGITCYILSLNNCADHSLQGSTFFQNALEYTNTTLPLSSRVELDGLLINWKVKAVLDEDRRRSDSEKEQK